MLNLIEMHYYVVACPDGSYHVQNVIGAMFGQHHVHDADGYKKWLSNPRVDERRVHVSNGRCNCGLQPGETKQR